MATSPAPIRYILDRLQGVRGHGPAYTALCPAHDDHHNSLSVTVANGKVLVNCFAGCRAEQIVAAIGLTMSDLFINQRRRRAPAAAPTIHQIRELDGTLVAEHCRQYQPDGSKRVWWRANGVNNLGGRPLATLPLYRSETLPGLAPGSTVIVTEGEVAADAVAQLGIPAVGTVTGASSCPSPDVLCSLVGYEIVLSPDQNAIGRRHMRMVADTLVKLGAKPRILEWKDAPEGGDLGDFVEQGGTVDQLRELVQAAVPYRSREAEAQSCTCTCQHCTDERLELQQERDEARKLQSEIGLTLGDPTKKPDEKVLLVLALMHIAEEQSHGPTPAAHGVKTYINTIAAKAGMSADLAGKKFNRWRDAGTIGIVRKSAFDEEVGECRTTTFMSLPHGDICSTLVAARAARLERPAHGGKREKTPEVPACPNHDENDLVMDIQFLCPTDGVIVKQGQIPVADAPTIAAEVNRHLDDSLRDDARDVEGATTEPSEPSYVTRTEARQDDVSLPWEPGAEEWGTLEWATEPLPLATEDLPEAPPMLGPVRIGNELEF